MDVVDTNDSENMNIEVNTTAESNANEGNNNINETSLNNGMVCDVTTESQKTKLSITLKCKICNLDAFKKRQVLKCDKCKCLVHFQCTQLPI